MSEEVRIILVVDDEPIIRDVIVELIRSIDPKIKCYEAKNGEVALKCLDTIWVEFSRDPDLIICDLQMPVMDGWDFIAAMKKESEGKNEEYGVPIIVLSASSGEDRAFLKKKSVHENKTGYFPLVTIAKDNCIKPEKYETTQSKGLKGWIEYFFAKHHFF